MAAAVKPKKPKPMTMKIHMAGLDETLRAFNTYGKDANRELRQAARAEVDQIVPAIRNAAGQGMGAQAELVSVSVKAVTDRVPVIVAGGSRKVRPSGSKRKVAAGDIFFGAEFGGGRRPTTRQFPPWKGRTGYWFWPTIRAHMPNLMAGYRRALEDLADKWGSGG